MSQGCGTIFYVDFFPGKKLLRIKFSFFQIFGGIDCLKVYRPKIQVDLKLFSSISFFFGVINLT